MKIHLKVLKIISLEKIMDSFIVKAENNHSVSQINIKNQGTTNNVFNGLNLLQQNKIKSEYDEVNSDMVKTEYTTDYDTDYKKTMPKDVAINKIKKEYDDKFNQHTDDIENPDDYDLVNRVPLCSYNVMEEIKIEYDVNHDNNNQENMSTDHVNSSDPVCGSPAAEDTVIDDIKTEQDGVVDQDLTDTEHTTDCDAESRSNTNNDLFTDDVKVNIVQEMIAPEDCTNIEMLCRSAATDVAVSRVKVEHCGVMNEDGAGDSTMECEGQRSRAPTTAISKGRNEKTANCYRIYRAQKSRELTKDSSIDNVKTSTPLWKGKTPAEYQREYRARKKANLDSILDDSGTGRVSTLVGATTSTRSQISDGRRKTAAEYQREYRLREKAKREAEKMVALLATNIETSTENVNENITDNNTSIENTTDKLRLPQASIQVSSTNTKRKKTPADYQREYRARKKAKLDSLLDDSISSTPTTAPSTFITPTCVTWRKTAAEYQREYRTRELYLYIHREYQTNHDLK